MSQPIKIIKTRDVIYEEVKLTPLAKAIIDTPIFQQTRFVKQLGFVFLVYASANHTRFEHMIGTYHITKYWINHLREIYPNCISDEVAEWICIGGLCHDLGHGPFSHVFDHLTHTRHELRSIQAFRHIVKHNPEVTIPANGVKFIEHVIEGIPLEGYPSWNFELVCNKRNNVDSDKFDYLRRDMYYCNIQRSSPIQRIIGYSRISEGHICFLRVAEVAIEQMFLDRYSMFREVYRHPVIVAIEQMLTIPMLGKISEIMRWGSLLNDPNCAWRELDDTLLNLIPKTELSLMQKPKEQLADWCFIKHCWDRITNRFLPISEFVDQKSETTEMEKIVPVELNLTNGKSNPLDLIYWYEKSLESVDYDLNRQSSEDVKTRIQPSKYQEIRHLKINIRKPLTRHYDQIGDQLPDDACCHNLKEYVDLLLQKNKAIGKTYYRSEINFDQIKLPTNWKLYDVILVTNIELSEFATFPGLLVIKSS